MIIHIKRFGKVQPLLLTISCNDTIEDALKTFLEIMKRFGYSEEEIFNAVNPPKKAKKNEQR